MVIELLDVLKDTLSSMKTGRIFLIKYQFLLQTAKATFNRSVVPAIAFAAYAVSHAVFGQQGLKTSTDDVFAIRRKMTSEGTCVFAPPSSGPP